MSNIYNQEQLENIHDQIIKEDCAGKLDFEVNEISYMYNLHPDDDRDEILQFIAEMRFYNLCSIIGISEG
jgi:hypothetical protein